MMGRYSYSQPSSSSRSLWSNGHPEVTSTPRSRCGSFGIPTSCECGLVTYIKSSWEAYHPGRLFFGCENDKDGVHHTYKWWDVAMMEELMELRLNLENQRSSITALEEKPGVEAEIAHLKELISQNRSRAAALNNVVVAGVILICLIIYLCRRS